jgi:hypothetical protein
VRACVACMVCVCVCGTNPCGYRYSVIVHRCVSAVQCHLSTVCFVYDLAVCPSDPRTAAVACGDRTIRLWQFDEASLLAQGNQSSADAPSAADPYRSTLLWRGFHSKVGGGSVVARQTTPALSERLAFTCVRVVAFMACRSVRACVRACVRLCM